MANTLYDTLEVIPSASPETIHAAYRSLISRNHPDKVAGLGPELQAIATARTKEINHAYGILRDAAQRADYDEELRERESPSPRQDSVAAQQASRAPPIVNEPRGRRLLATLFAALTGIAALLMLPHVANGGLGIVDFFMTGHARYFHDFLNPIGTDVRYSGSIYLLVLWGWLFVNYMIGLISYRFGVRAGERIAPSFAGINCRRFLFLTFVFVVTVDELFFSTHTMAHLLADVFVLGGAYKAERGIA